MCGVASVGVVQDRHSSTSATGSTFAHEVGHLLDMQHDSGMFFKWVLCTLYPIHYLPNTIIYTQDRVAVLILLDDV